MTFQEATAAARGKLGPVCKGCNVCNGKVCGNQMPGPGAKGMGDTAIRNFDAWREVRVNMDVLCENTEPDTSFELFGQPFAAPIFAGPVGAVNLHYGDSYTDVSYNAALVAGCAKAGIAAFTGDGSNPAVMQAATAGIKAAGGVGVPTVKPWNLELIREKFAMCADSGCFAIAMDVDAAGLPFLKGMNPPAGRKSVAQLREIAQLAGRPFIVKGIMTAASAEKAIEAGAAGIVVSNHGGRVLDQCPSTAEVLGEIVQAVAGRCKVFVDGGIRSGVDVFKALAMGADAVLVARPFVTAVYGGGEEGVAALTEKLVSELADTMAMCGAATLADITPDMIWL